jgi:putative glutamine amidotransferase
MNIGITYTGNEAKHLFYVDWITQHDADISIITLYPEKNNLTDLAQCHGVVLSGGVDIHPEYFNADLSYANAPDEFEVTRDDFEFAIFKKAKNTMPVLGICRGLQLVNVAQGGTLIQDLDNLNEFHRALDSWDADKVHDIVVEKNSLLAEIVTIEKGTVTSAHHQAIDVLGEGLVANSFSHDDNIIEGIEWEDKTNKPFMLCVQWHPERMFRINEGEAALSKKIRDVFVDAVRSVNNK